MSSGTVSSTKNRFWVQLGLIGAASLCSCSALAVGFWLGKEDTPETPAVLPPMMAASASATDTMAIATGPISDEVEGVFFLDFLTGRLQCLVYYPRTGSFGARFTVNVRGHLGSGKNSKFLMVTGQSIVQSAASNVRPAASLVYVTDTTTGYFAAYAVPWNHAMETATQIQSGGMLYVGGGPIRDFLPANQAQNKRAAIVDPGNNK